MNINEFRLQYPQYSSMSDSDLSAALHAKYYSDMPKHDFDVQFIGRPTHDDLSTAAVTADDSLTLQNIDAKVKPVIVGTNQEILDLKRKGQIGKGKEIFIAPQGKAYVIDAKAVQAIYGASLAGSVKMAKIDILKGNDAKLLGYPDRQGPTVDVIVNKQGEVITDLAKISDEAKAGNIAYGAEASPEDALRKGSEVSQAIRLKTPRKWKILGGDNAESNGENGQEGNANERDAERNDEGRQEGEMSDLQQGEAAQMTGGNLRPAVLIHGQQLTGADTHNDILDMHGLDMDEGHRGFQAPGGKFLSRTGGMAWLKQNQPDIYRRIVDNGVTELHSEDLNRAYLNRA